MYSSPTFTLVSGVVSGLRKIKIATAWLLATNNEQQEFKVKFKVRVVSYRRIVLTARVGDVSANIQTNEEAGQ